jgi:hypothetical protein
MQELIPGLMLEAMLKAMLKAILELRAYSSSYSL